MNHHFNGLDSAAERYIAVQNGGIGIFGIREMPRFYRHELLEHNFPHHGAVVFGSHGKAIFEALRCLGVTEIGFNRPRSMLYPTENPFDTPF